MSCLAEHMILDNCLFWSIIKSALGSFIYILTAAVVIHEACKGVHRLPSCMRWMLIRKTLLLPKVLQSY